MKPQYRILVGNNIPILLDNQKCMCNNSHLLHSKKDLVILEESYESGYPSYWAMGCYIFHREQIAAHRANQEIEAYIEEADAMRYMLKQYEKALKETTTHLRDIKAEVKRIEPYLQHADTCQLVEMGISGRLARCTCGRETLSVEWIEAVPTSYSVKDTYMPREYGDCMDEYDNRG